MKKVYFACSIRGGRDDAAYYGELVQAIKKYADVLTEIFADKKLTAEGMQQPTGNIWSNDIRWIGRKLSAMIDGSPGATVLEYTNVTAVEHAIAAFLQNLRVHAPTA